MSHRPAAALRAARLAALLTLGFAQAVPAQPIVASVFADYASYENYVVETISARDFAGLVVALGGGDEYTPEELAAVNADLKRILRRDFENHALLRVEEYESGFRAEARAFWTGMQYGYFFALIHERTSELVVLRFEVNTSLPYILEQF